MRQTTASPGASCDRPQGETAWVARQGSLMSEQRFHSMWPQLVEVRGSGTNTHIADRCMATRLSTLLPSLLRAHQDVVLACRGASVS